MSDGSAKHQAQFWLEYSQQLSGAIRYTEALAAVERSLALDDTSATAWYAKGTVFGRAFWNEELSLDQQEIDIMLEHFGIKAVAQRCPGDARRSESHLGLSMISKEGIGAARVGVWGLRYRQDV